MKLTSFSCLGFPIYNGETKRLRKKEMNDALEPEVNNVKEDVRSINMNNDIFYEVSIDDPLEIDKNPPPINNRDEKPAGENIGKVKYKRRKRNSNMSFVNPFPRGKLKPTQNNTKSKLSENIDQVPGKVIEAEVASLTNEAGKKEEKDNKPKEKTTDNKDNNGAAEKAPKETKLDIAIRKVNTLDKSCYTRKNKSERSVNKTWYEYAEWLKVYLKRDELLPLNKFGAAGANHFLFSLRDGKILCQLLANVKHCRLKEDEMVENKDDRVNICLIQKHCLEDLGIDREELLVWEDFLLKDVDMVCNTLLYIAKAIMFYHRNIPGMCEALKERARKVELPDSLEKVHEDIEQEPEPMEENADQGNVDDVEKNHNNINADHVKKDDTLSEEGEEEEENNVEYTSGGVVEQLGEYLADKATHLFRSLFFRS